MTSLSPIPTISIKKKSNGRKHENYQYNLYKCVYLLRVNQFQKTNATSQNESKLFLKRQIKKQFLMVNVFAAYSNEFGMKNVSKGLVLKIPVFSYKC